MNIIHNQRIRVSTLPSHYVAFQILNKEIQDYLTKNKMVQPHYKVRDDTNGTMYVYTQYNGRLEINYK